MIGSKRSLSETPFLESDFKRNCSNESSEQSQQRILDVYSKTEVQKFSRGLSGALPALKGQEWPFEVRSVLEERLQEIVNVHIAYKNSLKSQGVFCSENAIGPLRMSVLKECSIDKITDVYANSIGIICQHTYQQYLSYLEGCRKIIPREILEHLPFMRDEEIGEDGAETWYFRRAFIDRAVPVISASREEVERFLFERDLKSIFRSKVDKTAETSGKWKQVRNDTALKIYQSCVRLSQACCSQRRNREIKHLTQQYEQSLNGLFRIAVGYMEILHLGYLSRVRYEMSTRIPEVTGAFYESPQKSQEVFRQVYSKWLQGKDPIRPEGISSWESLDVLVYRNNDLAAIGFLYSRFIKRQLEKESEKLAAQYLILAHALERSQMSRKLCVSMVQEFVKVASKVVLLYKDRLGYVQGFLSSDFASRLFGFYGPDIDLHRASGVKVGVCFERLYDAVLEIQELRPYACSQAQLKKIVENFYERREVCLLAAEEFVPENPLGCNEERNRVEEDLDFLRKLCVTKKGEGYCIFSEKISKQFATLGRKHSELCMQEVDARMQGHLWQLEMEIGRINIMEQEMLTRNASPESIISFDQLEQEGDVLQEMFEQAEGDVERYQEFHSLRDMAVKAVSCLIYNLVSHSTLEKQIRHKNACEIARGCVDANAALKSAVEQDFEESIAEWFLAFVNLKVYDKLLENSLLEVSLEGSEEGSQALEQFYETCRDLSSD